MGMILKKLPSLQVMLRAVGRGKRAVQQIAVPNTTPISFSTLLECLVLLLTRNMTHHTS